MKFMLNGAVTLGTMDGANVEIHDLVGEDNIYIFGKSSEEVIRLYDTAGYHPQDYYADPQIAELVDFIVSKELVQIGDPENLGRLYKELCNKDWFMTLLDIKDYIAKKEQMLADYEDRMAWAKKMLINTAKAGFFSSDRTIAEYNRDIWKLYRIIYGCGGQTALPQCAARNDIFWVSFLFFRENESCAWKFRPNSGKICSKG